MKKLMESGNLKSYSLMNEHRANTSAKYEVSLTELTNRLI